MPDDPSTPPRLEQFFLVLLRKGPTWTPGENPAILALQDAHQANIRRLAEAGHMVLAGPFEDAPDGLRGLFVLRAESFEQAVALTQSDPAVQAGRLDMQVIRWWVPAGTFPAKHG